MRIQLITGISGSGKSVALRAFEDAGYDCIDNLPVSLIEQLVKTLESENCKQIAIAIDARRGDSISQVPALLQKLRTQHEVNILFLNADTNTLVQRFSETRRRHPLSNPNESTTLIDVIEQERKLLAPLAEQAQQIDTGLPNPHYEPQLRDLNGKDSPVIEYLRQFPEVAQMMDDIKTYLQKWLPRYLQDGRSYLTVAIGCTGGQHRSVYLVQQLKKYFSEKQAYQDIYYLERHRELDSKNIRIG